ncbi:ribonuclease H-like protein [Aspergillus homomorphus CBS 101889]|uniref:ribonuclease H n=1 Tax=Aspergillus homomorphus (strain CBS 101889) TaxID=1450537 RepID=A0A395HPT8_ASPHC|nr:ribonuclease H-like protein [Aspergillus homomorphus CBS 101889]RAL09760.1 ribonuclease H-like protein [Aspergillus homomorphus CBS 101889]
MVYKMMIFVDGGCRGNGQPGAIGAAASILMLRYGGYIASTQSLPLYPAPTNQRAELKAVILGLEQALARYDELDASPALDVTIHSDSRYVIDCMTVWIDKWIRRGWINAAGNEVANRDLLERASELDDELRNLGNLKYKWIPREDNQIADGLCNDDMDMQQGLF